MRVVEKYSIPSELIKHNYDTYTYDTIKKVLCFILNKNVGLPLSNQNIVSNFISNVFLLELDNYIKDLSFKKGLNITYFRYVDDFFILYKKDVSISNECIGDQIQEIGHNISDHLMSNLQLKINPLKSKHWIIEDNYQAIDFLKIKKFISFTNPEYRKNLSKPKEKLDEIIYIIDNLKSEYKNKGPLNKDIEKDDILKECFISAVKNYINSKEATDKLNNAFKNWNPLLTLYSIKSLLFLSTKSESGKLIIKNYLIDNFETNVPQSQFLYLLEKYLVFDCQDEALIKLLSKKDYEASSYYTLIKRMIIPKPDLYEKTMWYSDDSLLSNDTLMQQLIKMVFAEKRNDFTLALNHLLNCFQYYCYLNDDSGNKVLHKNYTRQNVLNFLQGKLLYEDIQFIMAFYDRRNKNTISHIGEDNMEDWIIKSIEYEQYKYKMQKLLDKVFPHENLSNPVHFVGNTLTLATEALIILDNTDSLPEVDAKEYIKKDNFLE